MSTEQKISIPPDLLIPVNVRGLLIAINNIEYAISRGAFNSIELHELHAITGNAVALKQEVNNFLSSYKPVETEAPGA